MSCNLHQGWCWCSCGQDKKIVPDVEDPVQAEIVNFENSEEGTSSNVELLEVSGLIEFEGAVAMSNSSTSTLPQKPASESSFVAETASFGNLTQELVKEVFIPLSKLALTTKIDFGLIGDAMKLNKGIEALVSCVMCH